jgi:hypothetical protein
MKKRRKQQPLSEQADSAVKQRIFRWLSKSEEPDFDMLGKAVDAARDEAPADLDLIAARTLIDAELGQLDVDPISAIAAPIIADYAVRTGRLRAAAKVVRALHRQKNVKSLQTLVATLDRSPWKPKLLRGFLDDKKLDYQVFHRKEPVNKVMFVCFTGLANYMFVQLNALHPWMRAHASHVIYLRDRHHMLYQHGIASIGNKEQTLGFIRSVAEEHGVERIACIGTSGGSFGALHYGPLLGAKHVLCLAGPTNLELASMHSSRKVHSVVMEKLASEGNPLADLRDIYAEEKTTRARIVYGEDRPFDADQAHYIGDLPSVELLALPDHDQHNVLFPLLQRSMFAGELHYAATGEKPKHVPYVRKLSPAETPTEAAAEMPAEADSA